MKNSTSIKLIFSVLLVILISSTSAIAQSSTATEASSTQVQSDLPSSQTVTFPIKAKGKTDPNYEKNLAKSKAYKPFVPAKKTTSNIKDEAYYLNLIEKLKKEITEREEIASSNEFAIQKIQKLKDELFLAQENYKELIKEN